MGFQRGRACLGRCVAFQVASVQRGYHLSGLKPFESAFISVHQRQSAVQLFAFRAFSCGLAHWAKTVRSATNGTPPLVKTIRKPRALGIFLSLLLFCSCATTPEPSAIIPASELPPDVTMNKAAGRGNWLFVTLRLESGEALLFFVDTGMSVTLLDKSLEPKLGKRLGTGRVMHVVNGRKPEHAWLPECVWNGESYRNLIVGNHDLNVLGLRFLARHLVTLDFPKGTMYLKQTSIGPLVDANMEAAADFLKSLKEKGQVP